MSKLDDALTKLENEVAIDMARLMQMHTLGRSPKSSHAEAKRQIKDLMYKIYDEDFYTFKKNLEAL